MNWTDPSGFCQGIPNCVDLPGETIKVYVDKIPRPDPMTRTQPAPTSPYAGDDFAREMGVGLIPNLPSPLPNGPSAGEAAGAALGALQTLAPGGFLGSAIPLPTPEAERGRAIVQIVAGLAELLGGAGAELGGIALDLTVLGAPAGALAGATGGILIVKGLADLGAGAIGVYRAVTNDSGGGGGGGGPVGGGAARAAQYGQNWPKASLKEAVNKFAPGSTGAPQGQKVIYTNPETGVQVVHDPAGNYFRIENPSLGHRRYLDMNGQVPNNKIVDGRQMGRSQAEYNQATHFANTD